MGFDFLDFLGFGLVVFGVLMAIDSALHRQKRGILLTSLHGMVALTLIGVGVSAAAL